MKRAAVVLDIDSTLYNFVDYFAPAFRAMVHSLAKETGISEDALIRSFRSIYVKYGSLEYPYTVQKLDVFQTDQWKYHLDDLAHIAKVAFSRSRRLRLKAYPGVQGTLEWLFRNGYPLIAYTDGALGYTWGKLHALGVSRFFEAVVAWGTSRTEKAGLDVDTASVESRWWDATSGYARPSGLAWAVANDQRKPNPELLERLADELDIDIEASWVVGDSLDKDLVPAWQLGFSSVWARYGLECEPHNLETVVSVGPRENDPDRSPPPPRPDGFVPDHIIDAFSDLREFIPPRQLSLF